MNKKFSIILSVIILSILSIYVLNLSKKNITPIHNNDFQKTITTGNKVANDSAIPKVESVSTSNKDLTLKVISPNGGEKLEAGSDNIIKWQTSDNVFNKPVSIVLIKKDSRSPYNSAIININYKSEINSYLWDNQYTYSTLYNPINGDAVLEFPGPGRYVIRVCDLQANICDESDNYFTILPSDPKKRIIVLSPNGGEKWIDKSIHQIIWSNSSTTTSTVDLYLLDDLRCGYYSEDFPDYPTCPQTYIALAKNINNNSIYNWIVGTDINNDKITPGKYKIAVCKAGNYTCDFSDSEFYIISK